MMLMKSEESSGKLLRAWRDADAAALSKQAPLQAQPFSSAEVQSCMQGLLATVVFPFVAATSVQRSPAKRCAHGSTIVGGIVGGGLYNFS